MIGERDFGELGMLSGDCDMLAGDDDNPLLNMCGNGDGVGPPFGDRRVPFLSVGLGGRGGGDVGFAGGGGFGADKDDDDNLPFRVELSVSLSGNCAMSENTPTNFSKFGPQLRR